MRLYKAKIVDLKRSKHLIGWYYPVFEYVDLDGEKRRYTRCSGMEITPFSQHKNYTILRNRLRSCEKSEDAMLRFLYSPAVLTKPFVMLFIIPNTILLLLISSMLPMIVTQIIKALKIGKMKKATRIIQPIGGRIVGYRQGHRDVTNRRVYGWCKPIIEYQYNNHTYYHISRIYRCGHKRSSIGDSCDIYLDPRSQRVFDNFEASAPFYWWFYQQIAMPLSAIKHCVSTALAQLLSVRKKGSQTENKLPPPMVSPLRTLTYRPQKW